MCNNLEFLKELTCFWNTTYINLEIRKYNMLEKRSHFTISHEAITVWFYNDVILHCAFKRTSFYLPRFCLIVAIRYPFIMCHVRCNICKYNPIKRKNEPISNVYILVYTYEYRRIDLTTLGKQHKEQAFIVMLILKNLI